MAAVITVVRIWNQPSNGEEIMNSGTHMNGIWMELNKIREISHIPSHMYIPGSHFYTCALMTEGVCVDARKLETGTQEDKKETL